MILNQQKIIFYVVVFFWVTFWGILGTKINSYIHYENIIFIWEYNFGTFFELIRNNIVVLIFIILLYSLSKKREVSNYLLFALYPLSAYIGFYISGEIENESHIFAANFFISLTTLALYINFFVNKKFLNVKDTILILKISLLVLFTYFLVMLLPKIIYSLSMLATNLRGFEHKTLLIGENFLIQLPQNSNGASRIFVIFYLFIILRLRKNIMKNKNYIKYFILSLIIITILYMYQSKLSTLFSYIFTIYLIINIKEINLKKKSFLISFLLIFPILFFNLNSFSKNSKELHSILGEKVEIEKYVEDLVKKNLSEDAVNYIKENPNFINNKYEILNNSEDIEMLKNLDNKLKHQSNFETKKWIQDTKKNQNEILIIDKYLLQRKQSNIKSEIIDLLKTDPELLANYKSHVKQKSQNAAKNVINSIKYNRIFSFDITSESINTISGNEFLLKKQKENLLLKPKNINYRLECLLNDTIPDRLTSGRLCGWILIITKMKLKNLMFGNGFFADQKMLNKYEKLASNSFMFVFYNAGVLGSIGFISFYIIFLKKTYNIYNLNRKLKYDFYFQFCLSLIFYMVFRSIFEDTIGFLSVDLLILVNTVLYMEKKSIELKGVNSFN